MRYLNIETLTVLLLGMYTPLIIYHVFIFFGRKNELTNLSYANLCFSMFLTMLVSRIIPEIMNISPIFIMQYVMPILIIYMALSVLFFYSTVYDHKKIKKFCIFYSITIVFLCLLSTATQIKVLKISFYLSLALLTVIYFIALVFVIFKDGQLKARKQRYIFLSSVFLVFGLLVAIPFYTTGTFMEMNELARACVSFLLILVIFLYALAIASDFNQEHKDLEDHKNTLEKKVDEATHILRTQKEKNKKTYLDFSHELKTALQSIQGNLYLMYKDGTKKNELLPVIMKGVVKLINDAANFLDIVKIENNQKLYEHTTAVNLSAFIKEQIALRKDAALQRNIKIRGIRTNDLFIKCNVDAADRILNNLIGNAIKYSETGKKESVTIDLMPEGKNIKLIIRDTGIGIKENDLPHVFEPGYRGELAERACIDGNGNGLGIVKEIITSLDGTIEIQSSEGEGTLLTVVIPVYKPAQGEKVYTTPLEEKIKEPVRKASSFSKDQDKNLPKVLIVEDNRDLLNFYQDHLSTGYRLFLATNGHEALEMLKKIPRPDVIISDRKMPVMGGDDFFIATRKEYGKVPFIFITAWDEPGKKYQALDGGAVEYLTKTFDPEELFKKIGSLIAIKEPEEEKDMIKSLDLVGIEEIRKAVLKYKDEYNLQPQQIDVIILLIAGKNYNEIAEELETTYHSVANQKNRILEKMPINRAEIPKPDRYDLARIFEII